MLWTKERREMLREFVRAGRTEKEIRSLIPLPGQPGLYCYHNAIQRYTRQADRAAGKWQRHHRDFAQKAAPLRHIPAWLDALMTPEQRETALFDPNPLPAFHPITCRENACYSQNYGETRP